MISYKTELAAGIEKSGLTLQRIANRIDSAKGYVSGLKNGKVAPASARVTRKLARVLDLSPDRMMALAVIEKMPKALSLRALGNVVDELLAAEEKRITDAAELAHADQHKAQAS